MPGSWQNWLADLGHLVDYARTRMVALALYSEHTSTQCLVRLHTLESAPEYETNVRKKSHLAS